MKVPYDSLPVLLDGNRQALGPVSEAQNSLLPVRLLPGVYRDKKPFRAWLSPVG